MFKRNKSGKKSKSKVIYTFPNSKMFTDEKC